MAARQAARLLFSPLDFGKHLNIRIRETSLYRCWEKRTGPNKTATVLSAELTNPWHPKKSANFGHVLGEVEILVAPGVRISLLQQSVVAKRLSFSGKTPALAQ
jgi:hypothetical protein